jgi:archaemetzincin
MSVTIQLVPLGLPPAAILAFLQEHLAQVFGASVSIGSHLPLPAWTFQRKRRQFDSHAILEWLRQFDVAVGAIVLAVIPEDLYADSLHFVFGEADPRGKRAIIGLARLYTGYPGKPFSEELLQERVLKEAVHEIGHVFGLLHCPEPRCVMRFSNSLYDTDVKTAKFCRFCMRKLGSTRRAGATLSLSGGASHTLC